VGSVVGQIAKLKGCTVVGIAGGEKKCDCVMGELGFIGFDDYGSRFSEFASAMGEWVGEDKVKVREDIVFGLENAPEAFIGLLQGRNFGKLVIQLAHP
jgi:NADPH-dependent curcumin reductase CurA